MKLQKLHKSKTEKVRYPLIKVISDESKITFTIIACWKKGRTPNIRIVVSSSKTILFNERHKRYNFELSFVMMKKRQENGNK